MNGDLDTLRTMSELVELSGAPARVGRGASAVRSRPRAASARRPVGARLVGGLREQLQRGDDAIAIVGRHAPHDRVDLAAALVHHLVDEALARRGELDHDFAPVERRRLAHDEPACDEPAAHARHRGRVHVEPLGERAHGLRALERHDHQRAELRERDLVAHRRQRPHGDADERTTGAHDRVDDRVVALDRLFVHRTSTRASPAGILRRRIAANRTRRSPESPQSVGPRRTVRRMSQE